MLAAVAVLASLAFIGWLIYHALKQKPVRAHIIIRSLAYEAGIYTFAFFLIQVVSGRHNALNVGVVLIPVLFLVLVDRVSASAKLYSHLLFLGQMVYDHKCVQAEVMVLGYFLWAVLVSDIEHPWG